MDLRVPSAAWLADALRSALLPRPDAVGMHLDAAAPEAPLEHAAAGPAAEPGVDREPVAEALRPGAPLAAVLQDTQNRVDEDDVRNPHVPALNWQEVVESGVLFRRDLFHDCAPLDCYLIVDKHLELVRKLSGLVNMWYLLSSENPTWRVRWPGRNWPHAAS